MPFVFGKAVSHTRFAAMFFILSSFINVVVLLYTLGFFVFMQTLPTDRTLPAASADAIVVLTGRQGRIDEGLRLFQEGHARFFYVSGVHPDVKKTELIERGKIPAAKMACCVIFDSVARNTVQNAEQTAAWVRNQKINHLILVTDDLHLPRAMILFKKALPDRIITPHPLLIEPLFQEGRWKDPNAWWGPIKEYTKFLFVRLSA
jgi:uncharacterized SAM-binding protein YcdF (DUF218 family)